MSNEIRAHCLKNHGNAYMSPPKLSAMPTISPNGVTKITVNCPKCNKSINQKSLSNHVKSCRWTGEIQKYVQQVRFVYKNFVKSEFEKS